MELAETQNDGSGAPATSRGKPICHQDSGDRFQVSRTSFGSQPSMSAMRSMQSARTVMTLAGRGKKIRQYTACEVPIDFHTEPLKASSFSIFHQEVEEIIESESPETKHWLISLSGLFFQFSICFAFVAMNAYDVVFKKMAVESVKAGTADKIDNMTFVVFMGVVGTGIGLFLAAKSGTAHILLTKETLVQFVKWSPVGIIVSSTQYLTFLILYLIDGDLFKVLQQTRLLGVAIIARLAMNTKQSPAAWLLLVVTTLGAISFSGIAGFAAENSMFYDMVLTQGHILKSNALKHNLGVATVNELLKSHSESGAAAMQELLKAPVSSPTHPDIRTFADMIDAQVSEEKSKGSDGPLLGILLTFVYALADSFNAVYEQKLLKETNNTPFSIQLIYKLVPFTICALVLKFAFGDRFAKPGEPNMFRDGFFRGWNNPWAVCAAFAMLGKEWFQGVVIKHLDALVRQLCGIVTIVLLYFILKLHGVSTSPVSIPVMITIFGVFFSVFAYALVGRAHKYTLALEAELAEASAIAPLNRFQRVPPA